MDGKAFSRWHWSRLEARLVLAGVALSALPLLGCCVYAVLSGVRTERDATEGTQRLIDADVHHLSQGVIALCEVSRDLLDRAARRNLQTARTVLERQRGVWIDSARTWRWLARNQFSSAETEVELPRMLVGGSELPPERSATATVPVVDEAQRLSEGTFTIFERMDAAGSMLRVATNVIGKNGERAIGTYIPAVQPDGTKNPVVEKVVAGSMFVGRAFVVDRWYQAAYEPIRDQGGAVIGMLYSGVPEETAMEPLRKRIAALTVARTGTVRVVNTKAASEAGQWSARRIRRRLRPLPGPERRDRLLLAANRNCVPR